MDYKDLRYAMEYLDETGYYFREIKEYREKFGAVTPDHHEYALALVIQNATKDKHRVYNPKWFSDDKYTGGGYSCWITPKGMIFPISHANHHAFAEMFGLWVQDLENAGWLHVSGGRADVIYEPTAAQEKAIERIAGFGHTLIRSTGCFRGGTYTTPKEDQPPVLVALDKTPRVGQRIDAYRFFNGHTDAFIKPAPKQEEPQLIAEPMFPEQVV